MSGGSRELPGKVGLNPAPDCSAASRYPLRSRARKGRMSVVLFTSPATITQPAPACSPISDRVTGNRSKSRRQSSIGYGQGTGEVGYDDGWVSRDTRYPYSRGEESKCVPADPRRCRYRKTTPHAHSASIAARIEPPVGKRCVEPSPGQAINCLWGEFLECDDICLRLCSLYEGLWIGRPFVDVR